MGHNIFKNRKNF